MKKLLAGLMVLALTAGASSEIRLINGTGIDLRVDVLSPAAQVRNVPLPAHEGLSPILGGKLKENRDEVLVIRDRFGNEIERTNAQTNAIFAINNWGRSVAISYLGKFQGRKTDTDRISIINATGRDFEIHFEYSVFSTFESIAEEPDDQFGVTGFQTGHSRHEGEIARATLGGDLYRPINLEMEVGGLYIVFDAGGSLSVERIR